jgi:adenine phosphoribosyltransferase
VFKDLTPLLADVDAFRFTVDAIADHAAGLTLDKVVGIEARGFIFAAAVAYRLGAGFVPVRKPGKLPWQTVTETYELEYGTDSLDIHDDAVSEGETVLIIDDVLATGGTAAATCALVEQVGGTIAGLAFVLELGFLDGRAKLPGRDILSLITV